MLSWFDSKEDKYSGWIMENRVSIVLVIVLVINFTPVIALVCKFICVEYFLWIMLNFNLENEVQNILTNIYDNDCISIVNLIGINTHFSRWAVLQECLFRVICFCSLNKVALAARNCSLVFQAKLNILLWICCKKISCWNLYLPNVLIHLTRVTSKLPKIIILLSSKNSK